jgi:hypothetical protein
MGPPASGAELREVTEGLLDPRLLAAEVVGVIVQVAAVHAGIPPLVAQMMGQAAGNLFPDLAGPDPNASKVRAAQYGDFALSAAEDGSLINSPPRPQIARAETANAIDKLLGPGAPASPARIQPASLEDDEPASPASIRIVGSAPTHEPADPPSDPLLPDIGGPARGFRP